jgi:hypothetical protein
MWIIRKMIDTIGQKYRSEAHSAANANRKLASKAQRAKRIEDDNREASRTIKSRLVRWQNAKAESKAVTGRHFPRDSNPVGVTHQGTYFDQPIIK